MYQKSTAGRRTERDRPITSKSRRWRGIGRGRKKMCLTICFPFTLAYPVIDQFLFQCTYLLEAASRNLFWRKPASSISPNPFCPPPREAKEIACNYRMMSWTIYRLFQIFAVDAARWRKPPARISKGPGDAG
ncbi:hypothetical protein AVEN_269167-1 [Araneus ventricosus]|uniref:Uncharacterized protein n=1 Tax=Araneus ventricosus TaxID=182803 RepID=A0A4Y2LR68_ARAVE|nr:hypothetical protein AVEN_269167-1 [Araneus ventricosus]